MADMADMAELTNRACLVAGQETSTRDLPDHQTTHANHPTNLAALRMRWTAAHASDPHAPCGAHVCACA